MAITYYHLTENMSAEQRADLDFALEVPPERAHMRRPKGAGALLGLLGRPGQGRKRG